MLYLKVPDGVSTDVRRQMLHGLGELNRLRHAQIGDPATLARIEQYEMAFRMQSSVPEMADLSSEPDSTFERWREEAKQAGTCQNAALMARRLVERGVRFVQIYHCGWDVHSFAPRCCPRRPGMPTARPGPSSRTSRSAGCSTRPYLTIPDHATITHTIQDVLNYGPEHS